MPLATNHSLKPYGLASASHSRARSTVTVLHSGTTKKYVEGWENVFGGGKKKTAGKNKGSAKAGRKTSGGKMAGGKAKAAGRKKAAGKMPSGARKKK